MSAPQRALQAIVLGHAEDGQTTTYDAAGHKTGSTGPSTQSGDAVAPPLTHPVKNVTSDGGYTISYPNGTVNVHRPDGTAIHVEADGSTWDPIP
jgi:hypothetical protein